MIMKDDAGLLTVCELGRIGDIVASEPIYRYLKKQYPDRRLRWYTRPDFAELLKYSPDVDEVVCVPDAAAYLELKKNLPEGTVSYELNFSDPSRPQPSLRPPEYPAAFPSLLEQFAVQAGLPPMDDTPVFHFNPDLKIEPLPERCAVFHCFSNGRSRQWARENWVALAGMLLEAGWHVIEIGLYPCLRLNHPNYIDKTGRMDLQYAAKLIAEAGLLIGVESGFGHIANACGAFSIIITGRLHQYPDYVTYSGRYRRGEGCNLVRFYDVASEFLPLAVAQEVLRRYLAGTPMHNDECMMYCMKEQILRSHAAPAYRLKEMFLYPFRRLRKTIAFHRIRHSGW